MEYLLVIDYSSDAERKRIDYAIERWSRQADVNKPKGTVIHFKHGDIDAFLEDLYGRLGSGMDRVHVYSIKEHEPGIETQTRTLRYETRDDPGMIGKFLNYILSKLNATYDYASGNVKTYTAYTKKGQVKIGVSIARKSGGITTITVEGFGDAVSFVSGRIDEEMKVFLGGM